MDNNPFEVGPAQPVQQPAPAPATPTATPSLEQMLQQVAGGATVSGTRTSLDDQSVTAGDFDAFKGRKGNTDRIAILLPNQIASGRVHFIQDKGYMICESVFERRNDQQVATKVASCCEKLNFSNQRFAVPVIHYNTRPNGDLVQPFGFKLAVWRFGESIFVKLRELGREYPLKSTDLKVSCSDEQYQRFDMLPCAGQSIISHEKFVAQHGAFVAAWIASINPKLDRAIGKRLGAKEWAEVLGATIPGVGAISSDAPITDLGELLGQAPRS